MKKSLTLTVILVISLGAISCKSTTYRHAMRLPEQTFYKGKYLEAARMLLPEINKKSKSRLLFLMEAGYMLHAGGDYKKSAQLLGKAAKEAELKPVSITKQAAAFLVNETKTNYRGEDFEKVLVLMFQGINYLQLKKFDDARVKFRQVNNELSKIKVKGKPKYKQNIMAKYLNAITHEYIGDMDRDEDEWEYAYVELKQIYKLNPRLTMVYGDLQRLAKKMKYNDEYYKWIARFGKRDYIPRNAGELVVIFHAGKSPIKVSRGPLQSDPVMWGVIQRTLGAKSLAPSSMRKISNTLIRSQNPIPKFVSRPYITRSARIFIGNRMYRTIELQDIEKTAIQNLQDDYRRLRTRAAASIVVKAVTAVGTGIAVKTAAEQSKKLGPWASLLGSVATVATGAALFSTIRPDLRCWHTLPANLQLARIFLPAGKYRGAIQFVGPGGAVYKTKRINITIKKGEKVFLSETSAF